MIVDTVEYIGEPYFRIDVVLFASGEESIKHSSTVGGFMTAGKEVIFASDGWGANNIFHQIIIDFDIAIDKKRTHVLPSVEGILDGFTDSTAGGDLLVLAE